MPKCRGKRESTKRVNKTGKRSRSSQLKAARENRRKTNVAAFELENVTDTGDLPRSLSDTVSVTDRHSASGSALNVTASSSKRKFDMMCAANDVDEASSPSSGDSDDVDATSDHSDSDDPATVANTRSPVTDDSCLFVQVSTLKNIVKNLPCPNCQGVYLTVEVLDVKKGPVVSLRTVCTGCQHVCSETLSSSRLGDQGSRAPFATTRRMVAGTMDSGVGFSGLRRLCWWLDSPCVHQKTYVKHQRPVSQAFISTAVRTLDTAATCVREAYADIDPGMTPANMRDICVSYDASWMTRGHKSHYGFGCVIDLLTNLIIDYATLSQYCHGCATVGDRMDKTSPEYDQWLADHECEKNFEGTAGAMDAAIAEILWKRSVEKHGFRYVTLLSDGDARTYNHIAALNVYGDDCHVEKEECVNHVSKRLGSALRKVAAEGRQEGVVTGGKGYGKLTAATIVKLTSYYGNAIRSNSNNLDGMRNAVFATFFHALSTDEDPHHDRCPKGRESWCFFQSALAKGEHPRPHRIMVGTPLSREVGRFVRPVYARLGEESLLRRCLRGKTQNSNESVHAIVWRKCPKTDFCGKVRLDAGAAMAVCEFNVGVESFVTATTVAMGFECGMSVGKLTKAKDDERIAMMLRKGSVVEKKRREARRLKQIHQHDVLVRAEGGPSYGNGDF